MKELMMSRISGDLRFIALCAAFLVGCADTFPVASVESVALVERRARECLQARIGDLDDKLSSAKVVGAAVVQACRTELQQLLYTLTQGQGPAYRRGYEDGFWPNMTEQSTVEVLRRRASVGPR